MFLEKIICAIRGVAMAIVLRAVYVVMTDAMLLVHLDMFLAKIVYVTPSAMVVIALRVFFVMVNAYLVHQDMCWVKIVCAIQDVVTAIVPRVVYVVKVDAMLPVLPVVTLLLIVCVIVHEFNISFERYVPKEKKKHGLKNSRCTGICPQTLEKFDKNASLGVLW
jgi:hypothetical protein